MLLASDGNSSIFRNINALSYVIITIVNPIVLLSLLIYLWQMVRYLFMKNLYSIMNLDTENRWKVRFYRILTSKLVYVLLCTHIVVATFIYYVIFAGVEAGGKINANDATTTNSLSFGIMSFVLAGLIVTTFIWDTVVITLSKMRKSKEEVIQSDQIEGTVELAIFNNAWKAFMNHFRRDDPLKFRSESIFMTAAMVTMLISYPVGISDRYDSPDPNSPKKVVELLFDLLYMSLRIITFGGYIVFLKLRQLRNKNQFTEYLKQVNEEISAHASSEVEQELMSTLRDEQGYKLVSAYCRKEFSIENILLWKRLETLRADSITMSELERARSLKLLNEQFIARSSPYEVNVSNKIKNEMTKAMEHETLSAVDAEQIYQILYSGAMINICDSFARLTNTTEYHTYRRVNSMSSELQSIGKFKTN
jgi:hypothetical protein